MGKIISLSNVGYSYKTDEGNLEAVRNVTFDIQEGEFVVLLGHNGCGKSTLAKLLNGLLVPDEGTVEVEGVRTSEEKRIFEIRSKVGMVFQNPDNQTVASIIEDDVAFGPENLGVERQEIIRRVEWALRSVGMYDYRKHTPFKLSGGQKQRVAIASVLAMMPKVLILDESTSMLDPTSRKEVLDVVKELNKTNKMSVLLITHYMDEAVDADRILVMSQGEIIKEGTPKDIFRDSKLIKSAALEPPIATAISHKLQQEGYSVGEVVFDEDLVEGICRFV